MCFGLIIILLLQTKKQIVQDRAAFLLIYAHLNKHLVKWDSGLITYSVLSTQNSFSSRQLSLQVPGLDLWSVHLQTSQSPDQLSCILLIVNTSAGRPRCHGNRLNAPSQKKKEKKSFFSCAVRSKTYQGWLLRMSFFDAFIWWNKFEKIYFLHPLYFLMGGTILIES